MVSLLKFAGIVAASLVLLVVSAWGLGALYYQGHKILAICFFATGLIGLLGLIVRYGWNGGGWSLTVIGLFVIAFSALLVWWTTIKPSNTLEWQPDVSRVSTGTLNGDLLTIRNIRNLDYRTETDYTVRYYDKTFDLRKLDCVDLLTVYWMGPAIAHVFVSFGFAEKDFLAISVELRKEVGEAYQPLPGLFRRYEIYYVVADERDVIRLRTTYRNPQEQVYLYRTRITNANARTLLLDYVKTMNQLEVEPEFYNTLTTNCTTSIFLHTRAFPNRPRYNWKLLLSGYTDEYVYELGALDTTMPFEELKRRSLINGKANAVGNVEDFSQRIREGLPRPPTNE